MKLLALSDEVVPSIYSPAVRERFSNVDLVIGCGDLPFYYLEFVVTMLNAPLVYVHGNHDHSKQYMSDGRVATRAEGCIDIDGRVLELDGLILTGLGGSIRYKSDGEHQYTEAEMAGRIWRLAPRLWYNRIRRQRFLDILVTHSPPRGIHDRADPAHVGFLALRRFVSRYRPRYLLHGHAHVYRRDAVTSTRHHCTEVVNVYPFRIIEWESGGC